MLTLASASAVILYLLPIALMLWARSSPARPTWATALDIPAAVIVDLLIVLALTRVLRLETATFVSRGAWLCGATLWRLRQPRGPEAPRRSLRAAARQYAPAALSALAALGLSLTISRTYSIWDREWHTPLVTSLRGQTIPFVNVYAPAEVLHYHFAGDVQAAMIQSLSFGVVHASFALTLAHDVLFALTGLAMGLFVSGAGLPGAAVTAASSLAVLLNGPLTLGRDSVPVEGYSAVDYLTMSFRPHDALAGLFYVGFFGAVAARALFRPARLEDTGPALFLATAGLGLSDETSVGLLGLALGVTWLFFPDCVHPKRLPGLALLVSLLGAIFLPNIAFAAALAPGAQRHVIELVSLRSPGFYTPVLPLSTPEGRRMLAFDLAPTLAIWLGCIMAVLFVRRRLGAPLLFVTVLLGLSVLGLTGVEVNATSSESHRFVTCAMYLLPFAGVCMAVRPGERAGGSRHLVPRAFDVLGGAAVSAGIALGALSTMSWIVQIAPVKAAKHTRFYTTDDLYAVDCRRDFGATLGATPEPRYLSKPIWYAYAGCVPVFAPGQKWNEAWDMTIGDPLFGETAVAALEAHFLAPGAPVQAICEPGARHEPVCKKAASRGACVPEGARAERCELEAGSPAP